VSRPHTDLIQTLHIFPVGGLLSGSGIRMAKKKLLELSECEYIHVTA
jgi:hypothetical protein